MTHEQALRSIVTAKQLAQAVSEYASAHGLHSAAAHAQSAIDSLGDAYAALTVIDDEPSVGDEPVPETQRSTPSAITSAPPAAI